MSFSVNLSLCLPRDGLSVPVVRHICRFALEEVGVEQPCISDIELALTEACTNVLDHADGDSSYEVFVAIGSDACTIQVKDTGGGFERAAFGNGQAAPTAESGRGLGLMQALVDEIHFTSVDGGMTVRLDKALQFDSEHPVRRRVDA